MRQGEINAINKVNELLWNLTTMQIIEASDEVLNCSLVEITSKPLKH